jgi:hypothetical protein
MDLKALDLVDCVMKEIIDYRVWTSSLGCLLSWEFMQVRPIYETSFLSSSSNLLWSGSTTVQGQELAPILCPTHKSDTSPRIGSCLFFEGITDISEASWSSYQVVRYTACQSTGRFNSCDTEIKPIIEVSSSMSTQGLWVCQDDYKDFIWETKGLCDSQSSILQHKLRDRSRWVWFHDSTHYKKVD